MGGVVNVVFLYVGFDIREVAHDYATTVSAYITNELKVLNSYDTWHGMYLYLYNKEYMYILFIITVILYRRNEECGKGDEEDLSYCQQVGRN